MAKFEIKFESDQYVLYDDGIVFDKYTREQSAVDMRNQLIEEDGIADFVSERIDSLLDDAREKSPSVSEDKIRVLIVETLS